MGPKAKELNSDSWTFQVFAVYNRSTHSTKHWGFHSDQSKPTSQLSDISKRLPSRSLSSTFLFLGTLLPHPETGDKWPLSGRNIRWASGVKRSAKTTEAHENNQGCQLQRSPLCYFSWKNEPPGWQNSYHGNGSEPKVTSLDRSPTSSIYLVRDLGRAGSLPWTSTSTTTWAGHTPRTANSQA